MWSGFKRARSSVVAALDIFQAYCVELMDSTGRVMNLEPMQHSMAQASSVLAERQCYILLRVCQENEESGGCKHVSLLNNAKSHPELTGNKDCHKCEWLIGALFWSNHGMTFNFCRTDEETFKSKQGVRKKEQKRTNTKK
ncbi:uncharacterized protein LOC119775614 isoform X3 [Cyprinodon tularosa]|uniref:uncharacterized protein LOC119775614 isoform X3 n=1 Tax=Cyprinodon tularosa TaxID=77115 RepID=UPI0018E207EF|nr:uncharacterized protein LOC119775614 isoform X3 [Cyprinodon tularosa]